MIPGGDAASSGPRHRGLRQDWATTHSEPNSALVEVQRRAASRKSRGKGGLGRLFRLRHRFVFERVYRYSGLRRTHVAPDRSSLPPPPSSSPVCLLPLPSPLPLVPRADPALPAHSEPASPAPSCGFPALVPVRSRPSDSPSAQPAPTPLPIHAPSAPLASLADFLTMLPNSYVVGGQPGLPQSQPQPGPQQGMPNMGIDQNRMWQLQQQQQQQQQQLAQLRAQQQGNNGQISQQVGPLSQSCHGMSRPIYLPHPGCYSYTRGPNSLAWAARSVRCTLWT